MKDLIEALTILLKYGNPEYPTVCEHDILYIWIDPADVSNEDLEKLNSLGVFPSDDLNGCFISYKYGSA